MNKDQLQSTVRTVLKVGGGALMMKGYTDGSEWETITAGLVALAGFIWGLVNRRTILGPSLIAFALMVGSLTTGCKTVTDSAGNSLRVVDSNKVDRAAVILRNVVGDATAAGEVLDPGSVEYLHLVVNVLDSAIASTNTAPAALRKTLATLPIKELQNVWAKIAINNAIGAYEIFFQDKLAGVIGGNYAAVTLLTAFRDGIASALPQQGGALERGALERWSVEFMPARQQVFPDGHRLSAKNLGRASNPTSKIREPENLARRPDLWTGGQAPRDLSPGQCSSGGRFQSRPYPARTAKIMESAAQLMNANRSTDVFGAGAPGVRASGVPWRRARDRNVRLARAPYLLRA